ncbi:MAG: N-(5'-phosphoribosyl)anthranilate isomerase [Pseudomonadota bacterium]
MHGHAPSSPEHWLAQVFAAQAVRKGGIVRRNVCWVDREIGRERFENEVRKRGFRLIQSGPQFIVICNTAPLRLIC